MYRTSSAYKEEMKKDLRDRSFMYVYLGMINQKAQDNAEITSELADFAQADVFDRRKFRYGRYIFLSQRTQTIQSLESGCSHKRPFRLYDLCV